MVRPGIQTYSLITRPPKSGIYVHTLKFLIGIKHKNGYITFLNQFPEMPVETESTGKTTLVPARFTCAISIRSNFAALEKLTYLAPVATQLHRFQNGGTNVLRDSPDICRHAEIPSNLLMRSNDSGHARDQEKAETGEDNLHCGSGVLPRPLLTPKPPQQTDCCCILLFLETARNFGQKECLI